MPDELLHSFSVLLESMTGFFRFVGNKAHAVAATVKAHDLGEIAKTKKFVEDYEAEIFTLFDDYVKDGFDIKTATRQTNLTMKSFNHPWAVMNMTEATLRKSGRLRKPKESVKQTA
jgi:hypothetical protein